MEGIKANGLGLEIPTECSAYLLFGKLLYLVAVLDLVDKDFCRLEAGEAMLVDDDGCIA